LHGSPTTGVSGRDRRLRLLIVGWIEPLSEARPSFPLIDTIKPAEVLTK
jgi:hypothetical protein